MKRVTVVSSLLLSLGLSLSYVSVAQPLSSQSQEKLTTSILDNQLMTDVIMPVLIDTLKKDIVTNNDAPPDSYDKCITNLTTEENFRRYSIASIHHHLSQIDETMLLDERRILSDPDFLTLMAIFQKSISTAFELKTNNISEIEFNKLQPQYIDKISAIQQRIEADPTRSALFNKVMTADEFTEFRGLLNLNTVIHERASSDLFNNFFIDTIKQCAKASIDKLEIRESNK